MYWWEWKISVNYYPWFQWSEVENMLPWSQLIGLHQHTYVGHNNAARWTVLANFIPLLGNLLNRMPTITAIKKTITAVAKKKKRSNNVAMFPRFCWTIKIVCVRMELNPWRDLTPPPPLHPVSARKHGQSFPHPLDTLTLWHCDPTDTSIWTL